MTPDRIRAAIDERKAAPRGTWRAAKCAYVDPRIEFMLAWK